MLFIIILRINTFSLKISTESVKLPKKISLTIIFYYIQTKLSTYFTKNFSSGHKTDIKYMPAGIRFYLFQGIELRFFIDVGGNDASM